MMDDTGQREGQLSAYIRLVEELDRHLTADIVAGLSAGSQAIVAARRRQIREDQEWKKECRRKQALRRQARAKLTPEELKALGG